jgi:hypothetical protein
VTTSTLARSLDTIAQDNTGEMIAKQPRSQQIHIRTARNWLKQMGFVYINVIKGVFIDGHEWSDVVTYPAVFINKWNEFAKRFVICNEDGSWHKPNLPIGQKPLVLITHNKSTFNANDGKHRLLAKDGK